MKSQPGRPMTLGNPQRPGSNVITSARCIVLEVSLSALLEPGHPLHPGSRQPRRAVTTGKSITTMLSTSLIVPLEIAKLAFFVVYVAATVGVIVGVYWEGDQFPKEKQQQGWLLLVGALAVDTLFTILVFGTDGWISAIQRDE